MREFTNKITLIKNFRGVYDLDTSKGCYNGTLNNSKGCYNDCYAARYSKKYGYNFGKTSLRYFVDEKHRKNIIRQINNIDMPFLRIGVTGDPSENWNHTIDIIKNVSECKKRIIVITKHWELLTIKQIEKLNKYNVIINTSVSALDNPLLLKHRISQFNTISKYGNSVLRIISCDFNKKNKLGKKLSIIQDKLFDNKNVIDNVLRVYKKNEYVLSGVINIEERKFLGKKCNFSIFNENSFIGYCNNCNDMCGLKYFN